MKIMINEEQKLMNEVMDDSYYLNGKLECIILHFWKKVEHIVSDYDLDTNQSVENK